MIYSCDNGIYLQDYGDTDKRFFKSVSEKTGFSIAFLMVIAEPEKDFGFLVQTKFSPFKTLLQECKLIC